MSNIGMKEETMEVWCVDTALGDHIVKYLKQLKDELPDDYGVPQIYVQKAVEEKGEVFNFTDTFSDEIIARADEIRVEVIDELIWTFTQGNEPELPDDAYSFAENGNIIRNYSDEVYDDWRKLMDEHVLRKQNGLKMFAEYYNTLEV